MCLFVGLDVDVARRFASSFFERFERVRRVVVDVFCDVVFECVLLDDCVFRMCDCVCCV